MARVIGIVATLALIGIVIGGNSSTPTPTDPAATPAADTTTAQAPCTDRATRHCTPEVTSSETVRVDALRWKALSATTAETLGDTTYGGGAKPVGVFVVAKVRVHSLKGETADLTSDAVKLQIGNRQFSQSDEGMTAIEIDGAADGSKPFVYQQLGPGMTIKGTVVFDVPRSALAKNPKLRFSELGFGTTHGFIDLPAV